ncbi:hypothetical protein V491_07072 [Pseudogymnoascus sp. VKM F-3775]|nr:hypothetical protein V491_07072 [Pseudogymnoascus sp. VKM F-3775]
MASTSGTYRPSNHQGLKEDGTPDKRMHYTETYRPSHHHGLKEDGTPDKRMNTGQFAHGKVHPHQAGQVGGHAGTTSTTGSGSGDAPSSSGKYKPVEHGGLKADGGKDKRVGTHEFAHGKVDPHVAGHEGGSK